jgi:hypothetical protein
MILEKMVRIGSAIVEKKIIFFKMLTSCLNQTSDNKSDFELEKFHLSDFSWARKKAKIHLKIHRHAPNHVVLEIKFL